MPDAALYYCWSCDAHRSVPGTCAGALTCPRCGRELSEGSRLNVLPCIVPAPQSALAVQAQLATPRELRAAG